MPKKTSINSEAVGIFNSRTAARHISVGKWPLPTGFFDEFELIAEYSVTIEQNAYYIDGSLNPELFFEESKRYRFDVSDSSNLGFSFRFSTTEDGIHNGGIEYSVVDIQGNPGETGSYVDVIIPINTQIYYYNVENSNFGNPLRTRNLVLGNAYLNYIKTSPVSTMYIGSSYLDYAIVNNLAGKNINLGLSYLNYIIEV